MAEEMVQLELSCSSSPASSLPESRQRSRPQGLSHVVLGEKETEDDSGISESSSENSALIATATFPGSGVAEKPEAEEGGKKERLLMVGLQVFFPFLIAGFGTMLAGMLLDYVQVSG